MSSNKRDLLVIFAIFSAIIVGGLIFRLTHIASSAPSQTSTDQRNEDQWQAWGKMAEDQSRGAKFMPMDVQKIMGEPDNIYGNPTNPQYYEYRLPNKDRPMVLGVFFNSQNQATSFGVNDADTTTRPN